MTLYPWMREAVFAPGLVAQGELLGLPVDVFGSSSITSTSRGDVKAGRGTPIVRNGTQAGHEYLLLGSLRGEHKRLKCLMVTLTAKSQSYPLFQHAGTEFLHMLDGTMDYGHGRKVYRLKPGDSLTLDGEGAHGPVELVDVPIRFLSVIAFPDSTP